MRTIRHAIRVLGRMLKRDPKTKKSRESHVEYIQKLVGVPITIAVMIIVENVFFPPTTRLGWLPRPTGPGHANA
jgi:hypothetical protein